MKLLDFLINGIMSVATLTERISFWGFYSPKKFK